MRKTFCHFVFSAGRYVLMVSLHDRLGGHVMKWSNLKGQQWGGATLPLFHEGEFYNIELKVRSKWSTPIRLCKVQLLLLVSFKSISIIDNRNCHLHNTSIT